MITTLLAGLLTFPALLLAALLVRRLQPTGAHRAPRAVPTSPYPDSEPAAHAWCPECTRVEAHALHADGSRTCWTCNHTTLGDM